MESKTRLDLNEEKEQNWLPTQKIYCCLPLLLEIEVSFKTFFPMYKDFFWFLTNLIEIRQSENSSSFRTITDTNCRLVVSPPTKETVRGRYWIL